MSYFDGTSGRGALVYEFPGKKQLTRVVAVDTTAGILVLDEDPTRVIGGVVIHRVERFERIEAVYTDRDRPTFFHCYGRKDESDPGDATR